MGLLHQIGDYYTGGLLPSGKRSTSSSTASSAPSSTDNGDGSGDDSVDDYGSYGTQTLRKVKRATRRIGDKGDGR